VERFHPPKGHMRSQQPHLYRSSSPGVGCNLIV
jgi:hypothetical protein